MTSCIYQIKNLVSGKAYIGRSINVEERWTKHRYLLSNNKHYNQYLQRAWNKYGADNFQFSIIEKCPVDDLSDREQHWIDHYKSYKPENGYNNSLGGEGEIPTEATREKRRQSMYGKNKGKKRSDETKQKIAIASTGRKHSSETIEKLREINTGVNSPSYGKKASAETIEKKRIAQLGENNSFHGKAHSLEAKSKISQANKGKTPWNQGKSILSDEDKANILERLKNGESQPSIAKDYGVSKTLIGNIKRAQMQSELP